ncbi:MAG TPA: glycerol-3-phosphate 1-O-acyltransferase PlsY [Bacillota bacterium]|jgi:glycerol-3-phosphate acyltransferase PlsY|nr:glycerol-3-phosphate 1-O-acyltransferase PlsY [Candidatus Fermentithermobacillaceae bacterium]HOB31156.1 glycerol-3-phosphate 1-O-acyltransferase PlsY [Bacillota bacterium]HOK65019.1 glycerol-3-phosphate 1-O-acyltransferase PlsY [Bacillota bacterium]HOL11813.1 glycerol-3-phosphate 1-O-acyltransferase PlsY [Bacillota bacterium]HOQ02272.1 glycerol-3-phosphate 1-O-acyltransferase PlsY [Bacillota bacterium]
MTVDWTLLLLISALGYFLGSVPCGVIIAKFAGVHDLMSRGSGNIGATNVSRVLGAKYGAIVLVLDMTKGIIPAYLGLRYLNIGSFGALIPGVFAILGHNWSIFLRFKGGKGIATTTGVALVAFPKVVAVSVCVFVLTVGITKYVSLGSLLAVWVGFFYSLTIGLSNLEKLVVFIIAAVVTYRHKSNIRRLLTGTESRLGEKERKS